MYPSHNKSSTIFTSCRVHTVEVYQWSSLTRPRRRYCRTHLRPPIFFYDFMIGIPTSTSWKKVSSLSFLKHLGTKRLVGSKTTCKSGWFMGIWLGLKGLRGVRHDSKVTFDHARPRWIFQHPQFDPDLGVMHLPYSDASTGTTKNIGSEIGR